MREQGRQRELAVVVEFWQLPARPRMLVTEQRLTAQQLRGSQLVQWVAVPAQFPASRMAALVFERELGRWQETAVVQRAMPRAHADRSGWPK